MRISDWSSDVCSSDLRAHEKQSDQEPDTCRGGSSEQPPPRQMEPDAGKQSHRKCCGPSIALIAKEEEGAKAEADGQGQERQPEQQPGQIESGDTAEDDHQRRSEENTSELQ